MLTTMARRRPADALPPGVVGQEWRCGHCTERLGVVLGHMLRILAPSPWFTADAAYVRCPRCRSRESFDLADLAA